jgi:hypothetical protein
MSMMSQTYCHAITRAFIDTLMATTDALGIERTDVALSQIEILRALADTNIFVQQLANRRVTSEVSKGKFAGALLFHLRQCRPVQLLAEQNAIDKGIDATRFQDLVCVLFICEYILQYQPPKGILLELTFLLRQNRANVEMLGLLFEAILVLSGREGPHYMNDIVV